MIELYCGDTHRTGSGLCPECADLELYTRLRLEKCPYGETKPTCANCPIHCYQPHRRKQVRQVMAHAGPRMLLRHPILAIRHMIAGRRETPPPPGRSRPAAHDTVVTRKGRPS
jgi:hypothetical protein